MTTQIWNYTPCCGRPLDGPVCVYPGTTVVCNCSCGQKIHVIYPEAPRAPQKSEGERLADFFAKSAHDREPFWPDMED